MNNVTSMNPCSIIPFIFDTHEVRVIKDEVGNPWAVAKDICDVLGISDVADATLKLDDDEKLMRVLPGSGQNRNMWTVNEPGLYTLILRSNKPEAKRFKRWITHEVLPAIRKTGSYSTTTENPSSLVPIAKEFKAAADMIKGLGFKGKEAQRKINEAVEIITGVNVMAFIGCPLEDEPTTTLGSISNFIADCCLVDLNNHKLRVAPSELYRQYVKYSHDLGVAALISREFNAFVMTKFTRVKSNGIRRYRGIGLLQEGI